MIEATQTKPGGDHQSGITALLTVAKAFAGARGIGLSRVSTLCFNDGGKLGALEGGADIGTRRLARALQWFSANWPDETPWPETVIRPSETFNTSVPQAWSVG